MQTSGGSTSSTGGVSGGKGKAGKKGAAAGAGEEGSGVSPERLVYLLYLGGFFGVRLDC